MCWIRAEKALATLANLASVCVLTAADIQSLSLFERKRGDGTSCLEVPPRAPEDFSGILMPSDFYSISAISPDRTPPNWQHPAKAELSQTDFF